MSGVAAMHEEMHQRTSEEEHPGKEGDDVSGMLRDQKVPADRQEAAKNNVCAGGEETLLYPSVIIVIHPRLPFSRMFLHIHQFEFAAGPCLNWYTT
jgi:hypothetical protein